MKTVLEKAISGACAALVLSLAAVAGPACSETVDPGTGETHFLVTCAGSCSGGFECLCGVCTRRCDGDGAACSSLGAGASCETCAGKSVCDVTCSGDQECTSLGDAFVCKQGRCREAASVADGGLKCPADHTPIIGRPVSDCAEVPPDPVPAGWTVGCLSPGDRDQPATVCRRRVSDGSAWLVAASVDSEAPDAWEACTEEQNAASLVGCNFAACEKPLKSTCSVQSTCDLLECGGLDLDENGCVRPDCGSDGDCLAEQRCTVLPCPFNTECVAYFPDACSCREVSQCVPRSTCADVAQTGPRGDWVELELRETNFECGGPEVPGCTSWYRVGADGGVAASRQGQPVSSALSPDDLVRLRRLIDGPELRAALRDGIDCKVAVEDAEAVMRLTLSTGTLEREIAGCLVPDADNIVKLADSVARRH